MTLRRFGRIAWQRWRSLTRRPALDAELERELAFHVDRLVSENVDAGMTPQQAREAARRTLGSPASLAERCRDQRRVNWFHDLRQDIGYGCRTLLKDRVFTAVVVISLALGIGANAAVLGAMHSVLREALPLPDADRLVAIRTVPLDNPAQTTGAALLDYLAWKERSRAFDAMELSLSGPRELGSDDGAAAEQVTGLSVTPGYFTMLGVQALRGRVFTGSEALWDREVVLISHRLWQDRYGGDAAILNKQIRLDRQLRTIVGVMPPDIWYHDPRIDCWMPMSVNPQLATGAGRFFGVTARLRPGVSLDRAQADLSAIAMQLAREFPDRNKGIGVRVQSLRDALFGWTKEPLVTLEVAVALVLLIASANVASLLLSRGSLRQREMAMRISLGASRGRIVRQFLAESILLALAGGAVGLLVAWYGLHGLAALRPPLGLPRMTNLGLDASVLGLTAILAIVTGLGFGLVPALATSQANPVVPLKDVPSEEGGRQGIWRSALVAGQLALAVVLLVGAGLLLRSFVRLAGREINFDPAGLLMFEVRTSVPRRSLGEYRGSPYFEMATPPSQTLQRIYDSLRGLRGAESVAGISYPPVDSLILPIVDVLLESPFVSRDERDRHPLRAAYFLVTPKFFETMRTPVIAGRELDDRDTVSRPWVAVVNETAARRFWPGGNPIGRHFRLDVVPEELLREVVGVVRDIPVRYGETDAQPVIYASYLQQPLRYRGPWGGMYSVMTFMIRQPDNPLSLVPSVRRVVAELNSDRPIAAPMTAAQRLGVALQKRRYFLVLVGLLAGTAALLAAVGVYGVLAYSVSQRTHEIGIRKALGAGPRDVAMLVGRHALVLVAAGLICGSLGALALTRLIAAQLWTVAPTDPATFATVGLVVAGIALVACLGPTCKAIVIDPTMALRRD